ncbi:HCL590Cp [Eremothecium sinecaudum]|uniref:HCL590Cp n=1 Tax=Eremothecium sinecaudum TaxID=45286 RepID=A0A120K1P5_9SACH|nr:HCL590Cp [Eremothecium sinecaudum]AMD19561.1 HCL590Cp [Eremothecium sinecaudum]
MQQTLGCEKLTGKLMNLSAILLKEASRDSPSFRANVNHYHTQIENIENWIKTTTETASTQFKDVMSDFRKAANLLSSFTFPPKDLLDNGLIEEQINTPKLISNCQKSIGDLYGSQIESIKSCEEPYVSILLEILTDVVKPYHVSRRNFEYYQSKYDTMLSNYQAINHIETSPTQIRSDAQELYEYRKSYLESALNLVLVISDSKMKLDSLILSLCDHAYKSLIRNMAVFDSVKDDMDFQEEWNHERLKIYYDLRDDIDRVSKQINAYTSEKMKPSTDLANYEMKEVIPRIVNSSYIASERSEKSGWLFMQTTVGNPQRTIWVRRWCFLKKDVFGMHLLSQSKTSVEETDKFGILLLSATIYVSIPRKFCFQVTINTPSINPPDIPSKTGSNSIILQAETHADLEEWLIAFHTAKHNAMMYEENETRYEQASKLHPPQFIEFACSSTTSTDQLLTTTHPSMTKSLLRVIETSPMGDVYSRLENPCTRSPITTSLTKLSILANSIVKANGTPSAMIANFWGSVNWNDHCLLSTSENITAIEPCVKASKEAKQAPEWKLASFPQYYPQRLQHETILFRSLFMNTNLSIPESDELLLDSMFCTWSPNPKQEFWGVAFITMKEIFFYMNMMGFVCLFKKTFDQICSVELVADEAGMPSNSKDLHIHFINEAPLRLKIFLTSPVLAQRKLQIVLDNQVSPNPLQLMDILQALRTAEENFNTERRKKNIVSNPDMNSKTSHIESVHYFSIDFNEAVERQQMFKLKYTSTYRLDFDIPCKGLAHLLFGDKSSAFTSTLFLARATRNKRVTSPWLIYDMDGERKMCRTITIRLNNADAYKFLPNSKIEDTDDSHPVNYSIKHSIIKMREGSYYEIDQESNILKIPFIKPFKVYAKFILMERKTSKGSGEFSISSNRSTMFVYYHVQYLDHKTLEPTTSINYLDQMVSKISLQVCQYECMHIKNVILSGMQLLGKHGKVIKAIRIGGHVGVVRLEVPTDKQLDLLQQNVLSFSMRSLLKLLFKWFIWNISNFMLTFVRTLFEMIYGLATNITMLNRLVLSGLILSIILNTFLVGKTTVSFWSYRKADAIINKYYYGKKQRMERVLSIDDLELLSTSLTKYRPICLEKFLASSKNIENKYRKTRHELGVKRNDLLVELKILNSMEKELVKVDYQNFLMEELENCNTVKELHIDNWNKNLQLQEYCSICEEELADINLL